MEITEVNVFPVSEEKLKAFVSVVFDRCFMVNDIKIIRGRQGLFMSMPSRKKKNGKFKDVAHPLNNETRQKIEGLVLAEYRRVLEEQGDESSRHRARCAERAGPAPEAGQHRLNRDPRSRGGNDGSGEASGRDSEEANESTEQPHGEQQAEGKTLEEVEEMHLRESFWTVP